MTAPDSSVILIGFMGTGKTEIGRRLARIWGWPLIDTDAEIERAVSKSIPRIFAEDGETAFRHQEHHVLRSLALSTEGRHGPAVIATGGGTPLRPENQALLRQLGRTIWLRAPAEDILRRVGHQLAARPLLADHLADPLGRIQDLLAAREPRYAEAAHLVWNTAPFVSPDDAAAALAEHLCQLSWNQPLTTPAPV